MEGFAHLHVHSDYSLLDSACTINDLVNQARQMGQKALALTDKQTMYGVIPFYKACKAAGVHPVIGLEVDIAAAGKQTALGSGKPFSGSLVLLAENQAGYENLILLSSMIQYQENRQLSLNGLSAHSGGLIALSSGPDGLIERLIAGGCDKEAREIARFYKKIFAGQFYFECQRHRRKEEQALETPVIRLGNELGIPLVATNDVHYIEKEDAEVWDCLRCIRTGEKMAVGKPRHSDYYLKSSEEMADLFASMPEAVTLSGQIAARCQVDFSFGQMRLPKFKTENGESSRSVLRKKCERGIKERFKEVSAAVYARLEKELSIIDQMGFNDYFLIVWDLIREARRMGMMPGPGRGSAAGSLVAYALRITDVDPIKYNLLFERFLNPERITMPDIDIDFPDKDRDKMIQYASRKYGKKHVAQIITFGTLAAKAAIRDVGKVMDFPAALIDRLARLIPSRPKMTLDKALDESAPLRRLLHELPEASALFRMARKVEGVPRHSSIHAAGVVFSDEPLTAIVPIQEGHDGVPVTQYPMNVLEELGLLKIDFLGLRNLTFMQDVIALVEKQTRRRFDVAAVPMDDAETFRLLSLGDTTGVFQLESEGMRDVLRKLKPTEFEDIVAVNALYRPGPMKFIDTYIEGRHARRKVHYPHPDLEPILAPTCGVLVYQEQIMQIAAKMAGYTLGQADILRRAVSKKKRRVLEEQKNDFIAGCLGRHYSLEVSEYVYDLIVRFANYGFNRSHAVAYSIIAYRLAYLKAHYPEAFMAALLTSVIGHQDKMLSAAAELKQRGMTLYPPSVNESEAGFKLVDRGVRFGLAAIKNLGLSAINEIVTKRADGRYRDLFDFCRRTSVRKVNRKAIEALIFAGAMDEFTAERASLLATLDTAIAAGEAEQRVSRGQVAFDTLEESPHVYVDVPPFTFSERLRYEKAFLGMYLSSHPLEPYRKKLGSSSGLIKEIRHLADRQVVRLAVLLENVRPARTKSGKTMAFLIVGDESGRMEAVCFPPLYEKKRDIFRPDQMLFIEAVLDKNSEGAQLNVHKAERLQVVLQAQSGGNQAALFLRIDADHQETAILRQLKRLLRDCPGEHTVIIYYDAMKKTVELSPDYRVNTKKEYLEKIGRLIGDKNVMIKRK